MNIDLINGLFELGGAIGVWCNVLRLKRERKVTGVDWRSTVLFSLWGLWNLLYYPSLSQWWSLCGGVAICAGNVAWLALLGVLHWKQGSQPNWKLGKSIISMSPSSSITKDALRPGRVIIVDDPRYLRNVNTYPISWWETKIEKSSLKPKDTSPHMIEQNYLQSNQAIRGMTLGCSLGQTIGFGNLATNDIPIGVQNMGSGMPSELSPKDGSKNSEPYNKPESNIAESILEEAQRLTHGPRNRDYGHPLDDYGRTAKLWSVILGVDITPEQAALCMCAVKISRQINTPKRDNMTDLAGYAWVTHKIIEEKANRAVKAPYVAGADGGLISY